MAAKRRNAHSRWALALASTAAAGAFWLGIVNGPQPANATPTTAQVAQPTVAPRQQIQGQTGSRAIAPSQPSQQPQARIAAPRLRTRGS